MKETVRKITNHKITRHTKRILSWKLKIFLIITLPVVVFTLLSSKTDVIPRIKSFVVLTGSMQPAIPVGAVTYTQQKSQYAPGDIIAFTTRAGQTVTHRISSVINVGEGVSYATKGDANSSIDQELVPHKNIKGKVVFHLPKIGYLINFLRTPTGFLLFIVGPTLMFILLELWNIKREIEKGVERRMLRKLTGHTYEKIDLS